MQALIFATSNQHKVSEVRSIISSIAPILSLQEAGYSDLLLPETADSIHGNAIQKAQTLYELTGNNCFAEDTGLEVDALNGAPGVYTARYAGLHAEPSKNISKLLDELSGISQRSARFRTVIALIINNALHVFEGAVEGEIARNPTGINGFGYDPIFIPKGYSNTFAELSPEIKNSISHRSQAVHNMMVFLQSEFQT